MHNPPPPSWAKYVVAQKNGDIWCFEEGPYKREDEGVNVENDESR